MKIDFRLKTKDQVSRGLIMELIPGTKIDSLARSSAIYIDEEAFGFVGLCISKCWPAYSKYGHWGESEIPVSVWKDIVSTLSLLRRNLLSAKNPGDVEGLGFIFDEIKAEFDREFERMRMEIVSMIDELIDWVNDKVSCCTCITIIGV
ncbi:hypothetical protein KSF73_10960 [Burkholderiaceae bacterium DAT-1]|nr:hypothetical protein [Burkholderiaceae bacterium DAT-1]